MGAHTVLAQTFVRPVARLLRGLHHASLDCADRWRGRADDLTPPRSLQSFVGSGGFAQVGEEFLEHFRNLCDLQPGESVLDVGCGTGRMAIPLLDYLGRQGRYTGFDISWKAVCWCQNHLARRNSNFRFHWADVFNSRYNPRGKCRAAEYSFPCEDQSIDFVFATSVFTHMLPHEVRHYLREIHRVLKPGGRGLLTHFILEEASPPGARPRPGIAFDVPLKDCRTADAEVPESAIAFVEGKLRDIYGQANLMIQEPILFGTWSGRERGMSYQDIVLISKPASSP